jgi:hypothetical protein
MITIPDIARNLLGFEEWGHTKIEAVAYVQEGRRVVKPLDPILGERFLELVEDVIDESALDQLYNLTTR